MSPNTEKIMLELLQSVRAKQDDLCSRLDEVRDGVVALSQRSALHEQQDELLHGAIAERIGVLEKSASESGKYRVVQLEGTIETWKGRIWQVSAALLTSAIVGLVVYYLSHR